MVWKSRKGMRNWLKSWHKVLHSFWSSYVLCFFFIWVYKCALLSSNDISTNRKLVSFFGMPNTTTFSSPHPKCPSSLLEQYKAQAVETKLSKEIIINHFDTRRRHFPTKVMCVYVLLCKPPPCSKQRPGKLNWRKFSIRL